MAIKKCTAACKNLRSIRFGFDGKTRVVGASYDRRDRFATCVLRPNETINIRTEPECLVQRERSADDRLEQLDRESDSWRL